MQKRVLLYSGTADKIKEYIVAEKLQQGAFLPPERMLAEKFGVSTVTLKKSLKILCDENVLVTVPRRGTRVERIPADVPVPFSAKKRVGITIWKNADVFHTDNVRLVEASGEVFSSEAYEVVIIYLGPENLRAESWTPSLHDGLDGILVTVQELPQSMLDEIKKSGIPAVFVEHRDISPGIWIDEGPGIRKLMTYLVSLGHKRIAFISGPDSLDMTRDQLAVFRKYASEKKLCRDERLVVSIPYERNAAFGEALKMLEMPEIPTAFIAGNEFMAQGVLDAIREKGLNCPADVSVACFGGIQYSLQSHPSLTILTSGMNQPGMFIAGARMLCDIIERKATPGSIAVERELVIRESTALRKR